MGQQATRTAVEESDADSESGFFALYKESTCVDDTRMQLSL
jgi:hypothetical protein